ncbi:MAG: Zn-dependent hydrolase [Acidobacteriota bacterium]|nr:MAG: Zn-dependent hydrolase [Acidobacteriota bacterium]
MKAPVKLFILFILTLCLAACTQEGQVEQESMSETKQNSLTGKYTSFKLTTDLNSLTEDQRKMIPLLIQAAKEMDKVFWLEAFGDPEPFLSGIEDSDLKAFARINYGPWDRLDANRSFIEGIGPKPAGANFYPQDMTKEEFEKAAESNPELKSLYTLVRRDEDGGLKAVPYHTAFADQHGKAAEYLREAARLAQDPGLKTYLELRATALLNDDYQPSDLAWLDMKDNVLDIVIGPIESYEDQLYGRKAANEAFVLVKDMAWSKRLDRYAELLPSLQKALPVPDEYKSESPGTDSDLNAYDVVYYAGDCNAGSKTIAINLPNDEEVQLQKGTRRLQLKNAMQAKFDKILVPIADQLISPEQRKHITFNAFFGNIMFHEVAHGLGIKNTLTGKGTVREALKEQASAMEENKADVLGLFMITQLLERGEIQDGQLEDNYVTFLAGIFRSIRFGASSAHGRANLARFNYFSQAGAFARDSETGTYQVDLERMQAAVNSLSERIIRLQGDGDYDETVQFMKELSQLPETLQSDLGRLSEAQIPVDVVFEQGLEALGL